MYFWNDLDKYGDNAALITSSKKITYEQLEKNVNDLSSLYNDRNLAFLMCSNTTESITIYLSLLRNKIPTVLINEQIEENLLDNLLETYTPYYIWSIKDYPDMNPVYSIGTYKLYINTKGIQEEIHDELALLLTTSGSTGSPKLVRQSYQNIDSNTSSIVKYLNINEKDCAITTLPMHYTYGLSIINTHISQGAGLFITDANPLQADFWNIVSKYHITTFGGVPYTYEMLKRIHFFDKDISSIRYITQAGGKLGIDMHKEFAEGCSNKGIDFVIMYGQTEATARMSYLPASFAIEKAGSIGIVIPDGEFWLEDTEGKKISEPDTPGELIYRGKNVTMGYAICREDLKKGYENGDVLHTGDLAKFDKDGFYYVVGRLKRFLKIYGNRINLDEVELLLHDNGIYSVACGTDDNLKICVLSDEDKTEAEKYILNNTNIPRFGVKVYKIDSIPRNSSGKILYSELEKQLC